MLLPREPAELQVQGGDTLLHALRTHAHQLAPEVEEGGMVEAPVALSVEELVPGNEANENLGPVVCR
jgi:hypothetical protein